MALNKKPVNGMKDILPYEMEVRDYVTSIIKDTYRSFGFTPIETPAMESIGNLSNKQGGENDGAQIDLLIDRSDRVINVCEMKFSEKPYSITKAYADILRMKMAVFAETTHIRKSLALTMVTTYGVLPGIHAGIVQNEVTMDDLYHQA